MTAADAPEAVENDQRMAGARGSGVCLATVATASFLPGALVTVGSFLKVHPRFAGDVVVIHDGLPEASREALRLAFGRVRFAPVSSELRDRAAGLGAAHPRLAAVLPALYKIEAFRLVGYRKVLFCDGDLLFRRPVSELFDARDALICCGDYAFLRGLFRDAAKFTPTDDPAGALRRTFNDGFLLLDASLVGERTHADLVAMIAPETWRSPDVAHGMQFLSNRYFAGRQTLVSSTYNYLMRSAVQIREREGLAARDAKVLHFNSPAKPWMPNAMLRRDNLWLPSSVLKLWCDAWADAVTDVHLRRHAASRRTEAAAVPRTSPAGSDVAQGTCCD